MNALRLLSFASCTQMRVGLFLLISMLWLFKLVRCHS